MYKSSMYTLSNPKKPGSRQKDPDMPGGATTRQEGSMIQRAKQEAKTETVTREKSDFVLLCR